MERNYYKGDFERFLKNNADQYRMYPSEKVWNGIYKSLHSRTRWYRYSAIVLLLLSITTVTIILSTRSKAVNDTSGEQAVTTNQQTVFSPVNRFTDKQVSASLKPDQSPSGSALQITHHTGSSLSGSVISTALAEGNTAQDLQSPSTAVSSGSASLTGLFTGSGTYPLNLSADKIFSQGSLNPGNRIFPNMAPEIFAGDIKSIVPAGKRKKTEWQFHFTPTIGYRKLSENKSYLRSVAPTSSLGIAAYRGVNDMVDHKPDMGLEFGLDAKNPLSGNITLRTGIQFNVTRYSIKAYSSNAEPATIALNSSYGGINILTSTSSYRSNGYSYSSSWLENIYAQLALPLGLEFKISKGRRSNFGIASSLQPTYLLGKKAYLISSDYKNYVKVPHLVRRWNMNADIETYVSYSTGKVNWQIGPQIRYQLFSSFINKYPVKENLFDFGLKVGMSFNK